MKKHYSEFDEVVRLGNLYKVKFTSKDKITGYGVFSKSKLVFHFWIDDSSYDQFRRKSKYSSSWKCVKTEYRNCKINKI
jgi:hypothetical protein